MAKLAPVRLAVLIRFFESHGFKRARTRGSHITMTKPGIARPVVIPSHRRVSVGVILSNLKTAGLGRRQLLDHIGKT